MVVGSSVLSGLARRRIGRHQEPNYCCYSADLPGPPIPLVPGERKFQGLSGSLCARHFPRQGFIRSAHDLVWLRLSCSSTNHSATIPPQRKRTFVADSTPVLSLDKYPRIVVARCDCFRNRCRI